MAFWCWWKMLCCITPFCFRALSSSRAMIEEQLHALASFQLIMPILGHDYLTNTGSMDWTVKLYKHSSIPNMGCEETVL